FGYYTYISTLYSVILFCVFFWIPFVYFYYEEKDDDDTGKCTIVKTVINETLLFFTFSLDIAVLIKTLQHLH
ncbi:hypothetical protein FD755_021509, partial [Muntiacus reevesi]